MQINKYKSILSMLCTHFFVSLYASFVYSHSLSLSLSLSVSLRLSLFLSFSIVYFSSRRCPQTCLQSSSNDEPRLRISKDRLMFLQLGYVLDISLLQDL